jgi:hypothetical protein
MLALPVRLLALRPPLPAPTPMIHSASAAVVDD